MKSWVNISICTNYLLRRILWSSTKEVKKSRPSINNWEHFQIGPRGQVPSGGLNEHYFLNKEMYRFLNLLFIVLKFLNGHKLTMIN